MDSIRRQVEESIKVKQLLLDNENILATIRKAADLCVQALKNGNKILFAGNGGSAADSQHLAAELVNRFGFDRPGLAGIALTTDTSVITAISNDYSFDKLFSRQVESIGNRGDILISMSTSGQSVNIIEGIKAASLKGIKTIGITGSEGTRMDGSCDIMIHIPSRATPRIQEATILIGHIICNEIESSIFGKKQ